MSRIRFFSMAALLYCIGVSAPAVAQEALFSLSLPVSDNSVAQRRQASSEALGQVMVRLSGRQDALTNAYIRGVLPQASQYLSGYAYRRDDEDQLLVDLDFSAPALRELVQRAQLPWWPSPRPATLVLTLERTLGGFDERLTPAQQTQLLATEQRRGLLLIQPLWDLQDQLLLQPQALWAEDGRVLAQAAERYAAAGVLLGRMFQRSDGLWLGYWRWQQGAENISFDAQADSKEALLRQALDKLADAQAERYAVKLGSQSQEHNYAWISGLKGFADQDQLLHYLDNLAVVSAVDLLKIQGSRVFVKLHLASDLATFTKTLALQARLLDATKSAQVQLNNALFAPLGSVDKPLTYVWQAQ